MKLIRRFAGARIHSAIFPTFIAPISVPVRAKPFTSLSPANDLDFSALSELQKQLKKLPVWHRSAQDEGASSNSHAATDKEALITELRDFYRREQQHAKLAGRFFPENIPCALSAKKLKAVETLLQVVHADGADGHLLQPFIALFGRDAALAKLYHLACSICSIQPVPVYTYPPYVKHPRGFFVGDTALHRAAQQGDIKLIRDFLNAPNPPVEVLTQDGYTPRAIAEMAGHNEIVQEFDRYTLQKELRKFIEVGEGQLKTRVFFPENFSSALCSEIQAAKELLVSIQDGGALDPAVEKTCKETASAELKTLYVAVCDALSLQQPKAAPVVEISM